MTLLLVVFALTVILSIAIFALCATFLQVYFKVNPPKEVINYIIPLAIFSISGGIFISATALLFHFL